MFMVQFEGLAKLFNVSLFKKLLGITAALKNVLRFIQVINLVVSSNYKLTNDKEVGGMCKNGTYHILPDMYYFDLTLVNSDVIY